MFFAQAQLIIFPPWSLLVTACSARDQSTGGAWHWLALYPDEARVQLQVVFFVSTKKMIELIRLVVFWEGGRLGPLRFQI
jgi:hypothetical protein